MAQQPLFYYFGDDEAFFRTLQGEFKKHTKLSAKFERHYSRLRVLVVNIYVNLLPILEVQSKRGRLLRVNISKSPIKENGLEKS